MPYRQRLIKHKTALKVAAKELLDFGYGQAPEFISDDSEQLIELYNKKIKACEQRIQTIIDEDEALKKSFDLAGSVPGIGRIIAVYLVVYTNNFTSFSGWRKFAAYCGIAPFDYSSGKSINYRSKVSHLANNTKPLSKC